MPGVLLRTSYVYLQALPIRAALADRDFILLLAAFELLGCRAGGTPKSSAQTMDPSGHSQLD